MPDSQWKVQELTHVDAIGILDVSIRCYEALERNAKAPRNRAQCVSSLDDIPFHGHPSFCGGQTPGPRIS